MIAGGGLTLHDRNAASVMGAQLVPSSHASHLGWKEPDPTTTTTPTTTVVVRQQPKPQPKVGKHPRGCGRNLDQIAQDENGGSYTGKNPRSTASGKYQVLDSTWGGYGGFKHAQDAPPEVQEAQARELYAMWQSGKIPNPWAASGC